MTVSSEHAARSRLAAGYHVRGYAQDTALCNRPSAALWLA